MTQYLEIIECTEAQMAAYRASGDLTLVGKAWIVLSPTGGITEIVWGSGLSFTDSPQFLPADVVPAAVQAVAVVSPGAAITQDTRLAFVVGGVTYLVDADTQP